MTTKIKGYINKVIYYKLQNNIYDDDNIGVGQEEKPQIITYYTILSVLDKDYNKYKIKGNMLMFPEMNDLIECNCIQKKDDYESIGLITIKLPTKDIHIIERLMSSDKLKVNGIGKKMIDNFVKKYKENVWKILAGENQNDNKLIAKIREYVCDKSGGHQTDFEIIQHISNFMSCSYNISLSTKEIDYIIEIFEKISVEYPLNDKIIKDNILYLIEILNSDKLKKICEKINPDTKTQFRMMILHTLYEDRRGDGNTCVIKTRFGKDILEETQYLIENKFICEYDEYLYLYKDFFKEKQIAKMMFDYKNKNDDICNIEDDDILDDEHVKQLNDAQRQCVKNAFNNVFSIITGYPGVGKTTTVKSIKSLCDQWQDNLVVIAPTGKVVLKITNDLNNNKNQNNFDQIYTIHKFVNFLRTINSDNYKKSEDKYLSHIEEIDILVIDELSMVTNDLFFELLTELKFCEYAPKIVFIGDVDQLPAIGPGNILHSLINSNCFPTTKLTVSQRSGGDLYANILKIREDQKPKFNKNNFKFIKNNCVDHCKILMNNEINDLLDKHSFDDIMLITPTNANVKAFTDDVRKKINKNYDDDKKDEFIIGDYVMMKINCYAKNIKGNQSVIFDPNKKNSNCKDCKGCNKCICIKVNASKDLYNGMTGTILQIDDNNCDSSENSENSDNSDNSDNSSNSSNDNGDISDNDFYYKVCFSDKNNRDRDVIAYFNKLYAMNYLRLSYVNTIHKYQGSEGLIAIILITDKDKNIMSKNMLYTAVSRAKLKCVIIAHEYAYDKAFKKKCIRISKLDKLIFDTFDICIACNGSGISYWTDGIYGNCMSCCDDF